MTADCRIDFYIVDSQAEQAAEAVACSLIDKAWSRGHRVLVRSRDDAQQARLDRLLWTFRQESFLPHATATSGIDAPILIAGAEDTVTTGFEVLVNLDDAPAADLASWKRIAEISSREPQRLARTRDRFRHYRSQGVEPANHKVQSPA
ncbi:DNA polymerase III subunit chi [Methylonatrum kenyense]|uniref:DNA polymerase III subunit chi n=1 Tax=Methylonatrum kenyense TaxID=455253 RepID=UPI0020BFF630|nr:DNA polymerase III subunit chi [Methylonatrum kenyense]MCK8516103.1 DNA polymerase III subunit chi [Methylonatrum kenyense]